MRGEETAAGEEGGRVAVRLCRVGSGDKGGGATLSRRAFCRWLAVQRLSNLLLKLIRPACQISSPPSQNETDLPVEEER